MWWNINILNMYEIFNSVNSNRYKQNSNHAKDTWIGHTTRTDKLLGNAYDDVIVICQVQAREKLH